MNTTNAVKKTQGRRKIAIKPIDNQNSRHVTFSKRRLGLFKKASELCILSGAEIAILVQSLKRQRLFTFGHPNADAVIDRYLTGKSSSSSTNDQLNMQQNNQYYSQLCRELETEKKKKESIEESKLVNNDNNGEFWWNEPIDDMGIEELEEFMTALGELKKKVTMRVDELNMINGSSSSNSTMQIARFGAEDQFLNQQAIDYCSSIVPYDFNQPGDGQF
ncbi:agamous-like MADS-box protein AGL62 [Lycium barbarum]|uniref:agamous-like MADS-box protein AGL62 n=1 Tax=Lycium barbarum TaxID=112863 RepID=UPI00293ED74B|nr:agamous-like MADS-box protein AGL62 [Lycium barbarum]